jgi:hypothetical protein
MRAEGASIGWQIENLPSDHTGVSRVLQVVLPLTFPREAACVFVQPSAYQVWPHCEPNGKLCLWHEGAGPEGLSAAAQIESVLSSLGDVLKPIYPTYDEARARDEFAAEWPSYWSARDKSLSLSDAQALLLDVTVSESAQRIRAVCCRRDRAQYVLIGSDDDRQTHWRGALALDARHDVRTEALVVPLSQAPIGAPRDLTELRDLLNHGCASAHLVLDELLASGQSPLFVVFRVGADTTAHAALELTPVFDRQPTTRLYGAKARKQRKVERKRMGWRIAVLPIERADPAWIHGRGFDVEADLLLTKHVLVAGCGSLGGLVIRALASAGVGRLTLVDPDTLTTANLGRHVLSARYLNDSKAKALAHEIGLQLPHIRTTALERKYQRIQLPSGKDAPNLVISTTADWAVDQQILDQHAAGTVKAVQLTWAEPHAIAGHAVLSIEPGDAAATLFDEQGVFKRQATRWKNPRFPLLGCAGSHQPATFNRLQRIAALAVEQAVRFLVGAQLTSEHRAWLGDSATLTQLGGTWIPSSAMPAGSVEYTEVFSVPSGELS